MTGEARKSDKGVELGAGPAWDRLITNAANMIEGAGAVRRYYAERRDVIRWVAALSAAAVFALGQLRPSTLGLNLVLVSAQAVFVGSLASGVIFAYATDLSVSRWANTVASHARDLTAALKERRDRALTVNVPDDNWIAKELREFTATKDAELDTRINDALEQILEIGEGSWSDWTARVCFGGFVLGVILVAIRQSLVLLTS